MNSHHPYLSLPPEAFWRSAIAEKTAQSIEGLWRPKFSLSQEDRFATYGSCFAQEFSRALKSRQYAWVCEERAPEGCDDELARSYGYGVFSARTGNIYTPSLFEQWLSWADGTVKPPDEVWEKGDGLIDPMRPRIEPTAFDSALELWRSRDHAIAAFRQSLRSATCVVFTLGLTERWVNVDTGVEYPMCPGTVAGAFDDSKHRFENLSLDQARLHLKSAILKLRELAPAVKVLLTVSPVPLTATASGQHVLIATVHSKSILRAIAADASSEDFIDYFPSYEMIATSPFEGRFFEANKREVNQAGVSFVMSSFFRGIGSPVVNEPPAPQNRREEREVRRAQRTAKNAEPAAARRRGRTVCEESLLDAFGS